jgi:hypothetical protein
MKPREEVIIEEAIPRTRYGMPAKLAWTETTYDSGSLAAPVEGRKDF